MDGDDIFREIGSGDEIFEVDLNSQISHEAGTSDAPVLHVNGPGSPVKINAISVTNRSASPSVDNCESEPADSSDPSDIAICVGSPHKVVTNLETFVNYSVKTNTSRPEFSNSEFEVRRRYNDFVWLRERLEENNQMLIVPPLPRKHPLTSMDRYGGQFIERRCRGLDLFLRRLACHPILSCSPDFIAFLTKEAGQCFEAWKRSNPSTSTASFFASSLSRLSSSLVAAVSPAGSNSPIHAGADSEFSVYSEHASAFGESVARMERTALRLAVEWTNLSNELKDLWVGFSRWSLVRGPAGQLSATLNLLGEVHRSCAESIHPALTESIEDDFAPRMQEYGLYTEAVQRVLRRRDNMEEAFEGTQSSLRRTREELESPPIQDSTNISRKLRGETAEQEKERKQRKADQLSTRSDLLEDRLACANADLKSDLDRWMGVKRRDIRESLLLLAKSHVAHHTECQRVWQRATDELFSNNSRGPESANQ